MMKELTRPARRQQQQCFDCKEDRSCEPSDGVFCSRRGIFHEAEANVFFFCRCCANRRRLRVLQQRGVERSGGALLR